MNLRAVVFGLCPIELFLCEIAENFQKGRFLPHFLINGQILVVNHAVILAVDRNLSFDIGA